LAQFQKTPPNGLVLFVGYYENKQGKTRLINYAIEPFSPLKHSLYQCGSGFRTDLLREQISNSSLRYGFIVIDGNIASFHILEGATKRMLFKYDKVELPKKHGRGGQSKNRFARIREEKRDWYTSKIGEFAVMHFIDSKTSRPNIDGLILAGCADLKYDLGDKLDGRLKEKFISYVDVQYGGECGFQEALERSKEALSNVEFMKERKVLENFFEHISKGTELFIYGLKETMYILTAGVAETLIIWNNLPYRRVEAVSKKDSEKKRSFLPKK